MPGFEGDGEVEKCVLRAVNHEDIRNSRFVGIKTSLVGLLSSLTFCQTSQTSQTSQLAPQPVGCTPGVKHLQNHQ